MPLTHSIHQEAGRTVVKLNGAFTFAENSAFRAILEEIVRLRPASLVVDLSQVETLDSAALSMLVLLRDRADKYGGTVALSKPPPQISRIFEVVDFGKLFTILA